MKFIWALFTVAILSLITGCSTTKIVATPPQIIKPPTVLMEDCSQSPIARIKTNQDLLRAYQSLFQDFKECNQTKKALRDWYLKVESENN